ncbi:MAG: DUF481 domain-containing protein [bacterium]|nr:DUF481 domain-containing protein [bacterium]
MRVSKTPGRTREVLSMALGVVSLAIFTGDPLAADEVVLDDGTVIVGKVKRLQGKRLEIRTRHMGLVKVQRDGIVEVRTERAVAVGVDTGERWTGTLELADGLMTVAGETTEVIPLGDVVRIEELEFDLWDRLEVEASGGLNLSRGNSRTTTYRLGAAVEYDRGASRTYAAFSTTVDEEKSSADNRRSTLDLGHELWSANKRFSLEALFDFEQNESAKLDLRSVVGGAAGLKLVDGRAHRLKGLLGTAWVAEDYVDRSPTESIDLLVGLEYRFNRRPARLTTSLVAYPDFSGRVLLQLDGKLKVELVEDYDFDVTFYDRYDSDPPVAADQHDYGLTIGLGWSR